MFIWWYPLVATFVVSIVPIIFLTFIPFTNGLFCTSKRTSQRRKEPSSSCHESHQLPLSVMMCFASGSLLADAISHLSEVTDPVLAESNSKWALAGVLLFFFVDKFSRYASRSSRAAGKDKKLSQMNIGCLSLIADAVHNFTDGLAISASFSRNLSTGIATTFAIFLHEIPHELGDYAVLAKAGFNHGKIINLQIGTAIAAFLGTLTGLGIEMGLLGSIVDANFLLPLSCGGFLYLGLCTILAEVMADEERNGNLRNTVVDLTAFVAGGALLHLLEHHVHE